MYSVPKEINHLYEQQSFISTDINVIYYLNFVGINNFKYEHCFSYYNSDYNSDKVYVFTIINASKSRRSTNHSKTLLSMMKILYDISEKKKYV